MKKYKKKTDVNTASTFLQIVPTLMKNAVEQDEIDTSDFDFDLNANKELITKFRNTENGLLETLKHFRPEATLEDLEFRMEIEKGILNTPLSDQGNDFLNMLNDPFRWQADDALTSTMQEFSPRTPNEKDTGAKEKKDPNKERIYRTIRTIKEKGVRKEGGPELIYQGKVIKLRPKMLLSLNGEETLDATTVAHIIRSNSMVKDKIEDPNVTQAKDIVVLVLSDVDGNTLHFDEEGSIVSKEDGGKPVYQFLRDVRSEKNSDKLRVTDIYGLEDRIISPAELIEKDAHKKEMSMESYKKWLIDQGTTYEDFLELVDNKQQSSFKELQDLRDEVRGGEPKLLNITDISAGIVDIFFNKENPTLKKLLTATKTPENKLNIKINPRTFTAEILINDVNYTIDRTNLPEEYINQIAAVLVNPKLNNKQKNDFYLQFTHNTINAQSTRKLFVNYNDVTGTLTGGYRPDPIKNKQLLIPIKDFTDPKVEQIIIDNLLNESTVTYENQGINAKTLTYATTMGYNKEILAGSKTFYNYNRNTGKFNAVDYKDFLLSLDLKILNPADKKTNKGDAVNNPYFQFRIDKDFIAETEKVKEEVKSSTVDKIKAAKDDLVLKLKVNKDLSGTILSGMSKTNATFLMKVDGVTVEGRYEPGISSNDINSNDPVTFIVNDIITNKGEPKNNVVSIYKGDKKIGQVSEKDFTLKPKVTKAPGTPQQEAAKKDEVIINPDKVDQPDEESDIPFELDRSSKLPNNVTQEEITAAKEWWDNSPLSKLIKLEHMANIVNSDVYARFIIAGKRLSDVSIQLDTATGSSAVDLYHEAWHAFSQLYLTKKQKTKLYAETRKRLNNYELSPEEVEEIIAEDFREYAKDPKAVGDAPIRNTIFRRIWNFIKALFGKRSIQENLFEKLFFASKNPKLLNKYTPLVDNHMFNKLNRARGVFNTETKELVLNYQDSLKVSNQIDSVLSKIIDETYDGRLAQSINNVKDSAGNLVTVNKTGTIQILTIEKNKIEAYARTKRRFNEKLVKFKTELEATAQEDFNKRSLLNNKIRILETAIANWDNILEFHKEHSTFDLIKQKYIEIDEEETEIEGDTTASEEAQETEIFSNKEVGKKSLMQLAEKETLYILKSLFKIVDGKEVEGPLGFPELVDFSKIWNTVTKVIGGEKNPVEMYLKLQAAVPFYPELGQLVNKKFPDPTNIKTLQEFNIKAAFWQDFKKPLIRYVQLTVDKDEETGDYKSEVTDASIEFKNVINSFKSAFNSSAETKYISKAENNKSTLKLDELIKAFPTAASVDLPAQQIEFVNALGVGLQDLKSIKDELGAKDYGVFYLYEIAKSVHTLNKDPKLTNDEQKAFIKKFIDNPIDALYGKMPAGIYKKTTSEKSVIQNLARLQSKFGNNYASFSVLNAEKKLVNEFTEDSTVTMQVDAINNVKNGRDLWMDPTYSYMSYLNPLINGFTEQSQLLKTIFKVEENTWARKGDAKLDLVMVSGTQIVNVDGANTTSLDVHSKYIQELNMMLKSGFQEFMRHASKSSSFGMKSTNLKNLYVDIDKFKPGGDADQYAVDNIFLGYIQAELIRIQKIRTNKEEYKKYVGYNREIKSADGETVIGIAGEFFTAFDNILTKDTKEEIIEKVKNGKLLDYLESDPKLKKDITEQVSAYFERQSADNKKDFQKSKWIDPALTNSLKKFELSTDAEETMLIKAHTMNAWIHNFETASLIYGDIVQYNHAKQELHKRNPGSTSGGRGFMDDIYTQDFLNSYTIKNTSYGAKLATMDEFGSEYAPFNYSKTYNTAIMQEVKRSSVYIKNIEKGLREDYKNRGLSQSEIDYRLKKELKPYKEMEEGDGQGYITIDAYRLLRLAEKNWSSEQEDLFQKVISGKEVNTEDITQIFPVYKLQHFGHLANTPLPVNAMHKFALMPLIPSLIVGSDLESLHHQMMKSNIQYATFQTGSKVGSITSQLDKDGKAVADQIYDDNGAQKTLKSDIKFTPNTIYLAYLKNVTAVPIKLKGKTIFATQLRKLILEGLYKNGKIVNDDNAPFIKAYEDAVNANTEILKIELLNEIGYEYKDGKYVSGDLTKFMDVVQRELTRKDLPEHLIDYIQVGSNNVLTKDLSLHMLSGDIEKMITSLVEKRIVKQKVKGEALVQVASSMTNGLWDSGFKFEKAQVAEIEKYLGTNNLPFYNPGENGNTSAMKVAIALQGDFKNLLKLKDLDGIEIGTRKRLNELIKDDEWLNKDNNRKSVTLSAVRIPVQGMNSMEFMEVYEFLNPAAGSIIIPPSEIVAKSGADYDVDKLTTFMPNIDENGNYVTSNISEETLKKLIANAESKGDKAQVVKLIALQKKAIENRLIDSIRGILQLPDNYATLVRPNETYLMKDIADDLVKSSPEYGRYKTISPTNVFEVGYNLHKHEANMTGKDVLGIIALENALHPLYTALGAALPKTYYGSVKNPKTKKYEDDKSIIYEMRLLLDHNKTEDGRISLSGINSADGQDKIADLFSHLMNGSVDVEKDAWIFFIQANKELIPMLLNLLKAGVPKRDAVYFISQPLVREYANQQRLYASTYANLTGKETLSDENKKYNALLNVLKQTNISESIYKANRTRLNNAIKGYNKEAKVSVKLSGIDKSYDTTLKSLIADVKADKVNINDIELINSSETGPLFKSIIADPTNEYYHPMSTPNYKDVVLAATEGMDKFTTADLKGTMTTNDTTSPKAIAIFLHYLEYEKQIKDMADLKRQSNPDTATSKTIQEIMQRKIGLDILSESSKIDQDLVRKLRKESILGSFFDNVITQDLVEPIFPLTDDKRVSTYLLNYIKNNNIPLKFGEGADGITNFITSFKQAMVNYIYQNRLNEIITTKEPFPGVPELFSTLNHQAYVTRFMSMISENSHLKELYSVLEQITDVPVNIYNSKNFSIKDQVFDAKTKKLTIKGQISVLTLNNKPVVKGALADSYHQNLIDLADENVIKVKDPVKNKKISDMFKILPLISILQNGVGNTKYGLSYVLPDTTYFEIVEPASREFISNKMNTSTFDKIAAMMIANDPNVNNYIDDSIIFKATDQPSTSVDTEWYNKFRKYVETGYYQQFIRDLEKTKSVSEIEEINKQIRNVYIQKLNTDYPQLGKITLGSDNSTLTVENKDVLKQLEPTISRLMVGNHGIYIEFSEPTNKGNFVKKRKQYNEYNRDGIKLYEQFDTVNYANYKVGKWYADINEYNIPTTQPSTSVAASEYTNHSGGAYGGDTYWDTIGREFGVTDQRHYKDAGNPNLSQKLRNAGVKATVLTKEQMDKARTEVERLLGESYPDTLQGNLQVRNYYQVANADAVFAVAEIKPTTKPEVMGGTNTAVQLGIKMGKPVYVFDLDTQKWYTQDKEYLDKGYDKTKQEWDYNGWKEISTPALTKNFAGVGSRDIENYNVQKDGKWVPRAQYKGPEVEAAAKQAIRDVYTNTFKATTQQQNVTVSEAPVVKIETVIKKREPVSFNNTFTFSDGVEIKTGIIRLNDQQKTALQLAIDAINNKNTKFVLKGYAGTGKSTIAKFIQLYVNTKHRGMKEIVYAAPTHKASINLLVQLIRGGVTKKPITTAKLLNKRKINGVFQPGPNHAVPSNGILIIDESSMIDNSDYKDIYDLAQDENTTVIFMGDPAQLPPVGNSSLSPALTYTKDNEGYELTEIMRQKEDNPVLKIITGVRNNMLDINENFNFDTEINSEGEGVNFIKDKTEFKNKMFDAFTSEEYKKDPAYAKIITYSNISVALYNQQIFSSMNIDESYGVGSTLMGYEQSSADSIINNGQDYTVISNEYQESKEVSLYNERILNTTHIIKGKLSGWNIEVKRVFNESDTELIKTHSPQLLKPQKVFIINPRDSNNLNILMQFLDVKKAINNNTIAWKFRAKASSELDALFSKYQFPDDVLLFENEPTTMSILKKERPELFKIEADGTSQYEKLNIKAFFSKNIDYGYAVTAHKAQGSTYDNVFVDYENMDNPANNKIISYNGKPYGNERNMLRYVGLSRTSKMDYVYTNKASDVSNVAPIVKQLQEEVPDGQTGEVIVKKSEPEERNIKVDQYTFTIKPDGKIYFGNGKELTEQTIKNKVYIRKELQDGTLRVSTDPATKFNYYVLSDNTILGSGTTNLAKETVSDPLTKKRILEAASLYKKSC